MQVYIILRFQPFGAAGRQANRKYLILLQPLQTVLLAAGFPQSSDALAFFPEDAVRVVRLPGRIVAGQLSALVAPVGAFRVAGGGDQLAAGAQVLQGFLDRQAVEVQLLAAQQVEQVIDRGFVVVPAQNP